MRDADEPEADAPQREPRPRDALFELALERADAYLRRARRPASTDPAAIRAALEVWSLKTRFASRFDLDAIAEALAERARSASVASDDDTEPSGAKRPNGSDDGDDETPPER